MTHRRKRAARRAADRRGGRARSRAIQAIGTHNFSLLIALACPRRDLRHACGRTCSFLPQHLQHRPSDRHPRRAGERADDRDHLRRPRYLGRRDAGHVDGLHRAGRAGRPVRPLSAILFGIGVGAAAGRRQRPDHHARPHQRGDRHARHDGGLPRRRLHNLERPVDPYLRSGTCASSATAGSPACR